jgi:two-component system, cell cycle response regulator DivK
MLCWCGLGYSVKPLQQPSLGHICLLPTLIPHKRSAASHKAGPQPFRDAGGHTVAAHERIDSSGSLSFVKGFLLNHGRATCESRTSECHILGLDRTSDMKKTVLIVEDNELNMKLFNDLLEAHGYATLKTASGIDAIELARAHKPDLILMDIQLPEVSGLEVTKWLKDDSELRSIPVVAITAFAMKGDEERIRQGGCEAYLSKPISVTKFLETVRTYLGDA